ncbi:MAG TPA: YceI family protein, partial [Terriglobales bacterium]|nr:YceI family protein [Terriglobales bacterium]
MRVSVLGVITLLSVPGCSSRDTATAPAAAKGPDKASVPALPVPSVPQVSKWELDPENSSAEFVCKHVFSSVRGMFQQPSGTVIVDEATPANSKVDATLKVSSITTGVEERDTHLKSPDFF